MAGIQTPLTPAARRVQVLPEIVARKIAAGEVIDRPHAAVRELLDNAVDAGATEITLRLANGGIDEIRVVDNGYGMSADDLDMCWLPHATSKISTIDDLEFVATLGFRGEALSSLAACSRLEIVTAQGEEARRLTVHGGKVLESGPHRGAPGTVVSVKDLFFNMPARRRFLKSPQAEGILCRRIFLEKAAAHPSIVFRLFINGVLKVFLPAGSPQERIIAAWPRLAPPTAWWETKVETQDFSIIVVHARPEASRKDRKYIQIYANRRRIDEFALVQGLVYAYDAWIPGGAFPMAFVFVEIHPALVDFNIHPAKQEARFRDLEAVRHRIIEGVKARLTGQAYRNRAAQSGTGAAEHFRQTELPTDRKPSKSPHSRFSSLGQPLHAAEGPSVGEKTAFADTAHTMRARRNRAMAVPFDPDRGFRYLGQAMGVFLLAESGESLYIVDQHAAHEKIIFEKFRRADPESEKLLIPRPLDLNPTALMRLELRQDRLSALGLEVEQDSKGNWNLTALPRVARDLEPEIVEFLESGGGDAEGLEKALWADLACKAAVKDNNGLDDDAARRLLGDTFSLETPRCPHGRPLWYEVSRRELFELVGRTV